MARLPLRVVGLLLLVAAIVIPSCQAVYVDENAGPRWTPDFVQD